MLAERHKVPTPIQHDSTDMRAELNATLKMSDIRRHELDAVLQKSRERQGEQQSELQSAQIQSANQHVVQAWREDNPSQTLME